MPGGAQLVSRQDIIKILLVDQHSLFREVIKTVVEREWDLEVVGEARDGAEAAAAAARLRPDIALVDADLRSRHGVHAATMILGKAKDCRILVLGEEGDQTTLVEAVEAGARGYLTKQVPLGELIDAIRAIHKGQTLIPPHMLGTLLAALLSKRRERDDARARMSRLTRREREVLGLLARGADNEMIASTLFISPQTARTHVQNLMSKLDVHSRLEAAAFVTQSGILHDLVLEG
jgi:DNA-binding NarL/FixJ family response regulator